MDRQQEFVLRTIEERDVRFVRLWFTDVVGSLKSVALAPAEVEGAFEEGLGFDGSSIEGLARVFESDMLAQPDPATFQILPWRGETEQTSRMFCDILTPDGEPSAADPRNVLKRKSSSTCSSRTSRVRTALRYLLTRAATLTTSRAVWPRTSAAPR